MKVALGSDEMAVVTKIWFPQTIGLECARPGMPVFHAMLTPLETFQLVGSFWPSATPDAPGPRNEGQFCAVAVNTNRNVATRALRTRRVYQPWAGLPASLDILMINREGDTKRGSL